MFGVSCKGRVWPGIVLLELKNDDLRISPDFRIFVLQSCLTGCHAMLGNSKMRFQIITSLKKQRCNFLGYSVI